MYLRECVLTDHMPSVARVGCTEGPYGETGSMLGSCLYRARWGRTYVNKICVYRANRAILVCMIHHIRDTQQLISRGLVYGVEYERDLLVGLIWV